jgi:hypothetical protein
MKVEDGGATFSLNICGQLLTLEELDHLKSLDSVDKILVGNNAFTVVFKVDSFLDINASAVINAQQAIKKTLRGITRPDISSSDVKKTGTLTP